jgi:hypothetical protein
MSSSLPVPLDRSKAMMIGIAAGLVGAHAMRYYLKHIAPGLIPQTPIETPDELTQSLPEIEPIVGVHYRMGETPAETVARTLYTQINGREPSAEDLAPLSDAMIYGWGVLAGAAYGYTRTTTRWRDLAGGVFFGLRLWGGDIIAGRALGIIPSPQLWSRRENLWWLSAHWVFSFILTNLTRVVYRLVS